MKITIDTEKKIIFIKDDEGYAIKTIIQSDKISGRSEMLIPTGNGNEVQIYMDPNIIFNDYIVAPEGYYVPKTTAI
ncbi:hypothetical protein ES703_110868 [subsurface metagenome]